MRNPIKQPRWKKVEYPRSQIIKAGKIIKKSDTKNEKLDETIAVIDNWRAAHAFPLHVIYMNLRRFSKKNSEIVVVERLKRLDSIINKLKREPSMSLWTMQDLGGCRVIVPTIEDVYEYKDIYENSRKRHVKKREYDYIANPKQSGYRSLHVVYEYYSESNQDYNKKMLIEIQFRTKLQHLWATAVETMGIFTDQAIKAGKGSDEVKHFFILVSSLFANEEKMPLVPDTIDDMNKLIQEIKELNTKYKYLDILTGIKVAIKTEQDAKKGTKYAYCVLTLNYEKKELTIFRFKSSEIDQANSFYTMMEKDRKSEKNNTVLVRASSFAELKSAYPNYFSDISKFVNKVNSYIGK